MKIIDFKTSGYFPKTILFLGVMLAVAGIVSVLTHTLIGFVLLFISILIFTTHYRLAVDPTAKTFHDYVWILGFKSGDKGNFENMEYLFIKKNKVSQIMNLKVNSSTIRKEVFDGYLKFSETNKIHLVTNDNKHALVLQLKDMARKLDVKLIDYTEGEPKEI